MTQFTALVMIQFTTTPYSLLVERAGTEVSGYKGLCLFKL
jgi:hypothetical protein